VLPALERRHDVLAPTLAGHAGGPPLDGRADADTLADAVERAMDTAGFGVADIVGNSLGGYLALRLAARGRARSVVALAPAGGWAPGDPAIAETLDYFATMQELLAVAAPRAEAILATPEGRRRATLYITTDYEHIPVALLAHLMRGAATCDAVFPLLEHARRVGWRLQPELITCPVRVVWGTADRLLEWPAAAHRYRTEWVPQAEWVELDGVGHCPQLDAPAVSADLILGYTAG
jgi:pimeloyl-ACP methyl ester carboxylesterase